jgi:hypothetical protein
MKSNKRISCFKCNLFCYFGSELICRNMTFVNNKLFDNMRYKIKVYFADKLKLMLCNINPINKLEKQTKFSSKYMEL